MPLIMVLGQMIAVCLVINPAFFALQNITDILRYASTSLICAIPMTFLLASGATDPVHRKKSKFNYTPTLPISNDALEVQIEAIPVVHVDKTVHIEGTTNLFDGANLMLSMRKDKQLLCQAKAVIENRKFIFPQFSNKGKGFTPGIYSCEITLSIPSVQPKEFTKLAGIEYENLAGNFIKKDGVGPRGEYSFTFSVE